MSSGSLYPNYICPAMIDLLIHGFISKILAVSAEQWSKKCGRLRPQVKKTPPNFNQWGYL